MLRYRDSTGPQLACAVESGLGFSCSGTLPCPRACAVRAIWRMRSANLRGFVYCRCRSSSFSASALQFVTITPLTRSPRKVWCTHGLAL